MSKPKLQADTSLLQLLKAGAVLKLSSFDDSPLVRRSSAQNKIVAECGPRILVHGRPTYLKEKRFSMTKDGLTQALNWAAKGTLSYHFEIEESEINNDTIN